MNLQAIIRLLPFLLILVLLIWILQRRAAAIQKIRRMGEKEKLLLLNELTSPFGFVYEPTQDIFVSRIHAWQRKEGYEELFDNLASKFNMVIDAFPVYFDYREKTWLIEFWKGQYGINTGAEAGVYHANRIVPKNQRTKIHYNAVSDEEMPLIGICLKDRQGKLFSIKRYHWWLAAFQMGVFRHPKDLVLHASITFHDNEGARAFCQGLKDAGWAPDEYRHRNRRVTVYIGKTNPYAGLALLQRNLVQSLNHFYCRLYRLATRPFTRTPDRMLFLYEQLPGCFRRMLRLRSFGKRTRIKPSPRRPL